MTLPAEPEIVIARKAFPDAQALLDAPAKLGSRSQSFVTVGWYGSRISDERGSFALVSPSGPLADLVGEVIRILYGSESVVAYVAESATVSYDIGITRRLFAALELLSAGTIPALYEVIA